jgi:hypothetical protein
MDTKKTLKAGITLSNPSEIPSLRNTMDYDALRVIAIRSSPFKQIFFFCLPQLSAQ